jgi:hypothetical protein
MNLVPSILVIKAYYERGLYSRREYLRGLERAYKLALTFQAIRETMEGTAPVTEARMLRRQQMREQYPIKQETSNA